jgi:hypothetical protein
MSDIWIPQDIGKRRPTRATLTYNQFGCPPHLVTQRFIYTIPVNRQAIIERLQLYMLRTTIVGAAFGLCDMSLYINGVVSYITLLHNVTFAPAGLVASPASFYTFPPIFITNFGMLFAGDSLSLTTVWTADAGNTVFLYATAGLLLYDV